MEAVPTRAALASTSPGLPRRAEGAALILCVTLSFAEIFAGAEECAAAALSQPAPPSFRAQPVAAVLLPASWPFARQKLSLGSSFGHVESGGRGSHIRKNEVVFFGQISASAFWSCYCGQKFQTFSIF